MSYEEEDTCMSYEEEDTCLHSAVELLLLLSPVYGHIVLDILYAEGICGILTDVAVTVSSSLLAVDHFLRAIALYCIDIHELFHWEGPVQ